MSLLIYPFTIYVPLSIHYQASASQTRGFSFSLATIILPRLATLQQHVQDNTWDNNVARHLCREHKTQNPDDRYPLKIRRVFYTNRTLVRYLENCGCPTDTSIRILGFQVSIAANLRQCCHYKNKILTLCNVRSRYIEYFWKDWSF